jgi:hypothetical protein
MRAPQHSPLGIAARLIGFGACPRQLLEQVRTRRSRSSMALFDPNVADTPAMQMLSVRIRVLNGCESTITNHLAGKKRRWLVGGCCPSP